MKHRVKTLAFIAMLTLGLLMIALVGPFKANAAGVASSGHSSSSASVKPFSAPPMFIKNSQSLNWSGYAATGGRFTKVSAKWTAPKVTCSGTNTYSSFWVGLDGDGSNSVEQTGTASYCQGGSASYFAWY